MVWKARGIGAVVVVGWRSLECKECDRSCTPVAVEQWMPRGRSGVGLIGRFTAARLIELVLKLVESCLSGLGCVARGN
jgi:hypothetical protein